MVLMLAGAFAAAQTPKLSAKAPGCDSRVTGRVGPSTKQPLPRFESIKAAKANFRRGPGAEHEIDWVITLRHLPVCIISEHERWRRVELPTGERGWIHAALLSSARFALFAETPGQIRDAPKPDAAALRTAPAMAPLSLLECAGAWCEVAFDGERGYALKGELWGVRSVNEPK
ncbi:MAG: SH3 domain-containing protein [Neomegalonema sp.]|nr:SH3 domain-containing protein [Neomegalonema sp.]